MDIVNVTFTYGMMKNSRGYRLRTTQVDRDFSQGAKQHSDLRLIAANQSSMEGITGQELKNLGYENTEIENGRAIFYGTERDVLRTNLWLRTADRIRIKIGQFEAHTFDDLFEGTKALDWSRFI